MGQGPNQRLPRAGRQQLRLALIGAGLALLLLALGVACRASAATPASADAVEADRERYLSATWAPGQLEAHFRKHGREGPYRGAADYDAAARETIRRGAMFTYVDRETGAPRLGFYEQPTNRFTGLTRDGGRITTHFRPDRGEAYVRGLERSTYR